jgi:hypothetical protein
MCTATLIQQLAIVKYFMFLSLDGAGRMGKFTLIHVKLIRGGINSLSFHVPIFTAPLLHLVNC